MQPDKKGKNIKVEEDIRDKIYYIICFPKIPTHDGVIGGGVCIDPRGIVVSAHHNFGSNPGDIYVRTFSDGPNLLQNVKLCAGDPALDLITFLLPPRKEAYPFVPLSDMSIPNVSQKQEVFSYIHRGDLPFSYLRGWVAHNHSISDPTLSTMNLTKSIKTDKHAHRDRLKELSIVSPYRKAVGVIDPRLYEHLTTYASDLPLIQISGLSPGFRDAGGTSGCPVFKKDKDCTMIGIIVFVASGYDWVVPVEVIKKFIKDMPPTV